MHTLHYPVSDHFQQYRETPDNYLTCFSFYVTIEVLCREPLCHTIGHLEQYFSCKVQLEFRFGGYDTMGIANMDDSNYDDTLYQLADLFKVFGDPTRIRILSVLSKQELCVQDIADALSMTQSAISHQLRILKQSALVKFRREGKTIYYSLADDHVATIMAQGLEHVCE